MTARKLTAAQIAGHRLVTRGMSKTAPLRDEQLHTDRTGEQRYRRKARRCVRCEGPRDGTFPVCAECRGEQS